MAQRDYEDQPEAPDLGAAVQLESSQHLAGPAGDSDALDAGYVPPDRPYALDEDGVTVAGQRAGDSLDERLAREQPEDEPVDPDRAGRLTLAGAGAALERPDAVAGEDVGIDGGAASAEEAAVHEVDAGLGRDDAAGVAGDGVPGADDGPLDDPAVAETLAADPYADQAVLDAVRDARATDEAGDPSGDDRSGPVAGRSAGAGRTGTEPDPARGRDPVDRDPAARIDGLPEAGGAAAPASGREDVGPGSGL
jgi:hypothetical protein